MSHLKPGGFIGSLAFNRFIQEPVHVESTATATAADHETDISQPEFVYVESSILEDGSSIYGDGDGRSTRQIVKGAFLHLMRQDHIIGKVAKSLVSDVMGMRVHVDEMERCKTTVTATSDVSLRRRLSSVLFLSITLCDACRDVVFLCRVAPLCVVGGCTLDTDPAAK